MPRKPVTDPHKVWNIAHHKRLEAYNKRIEQLLNRAITKAADLAMRHGAEATADHPFSYADDKQLKAGTEKLLKDLSKEITAVTKSAEGKEWDKAYQQATEYLSQVYNVAKQAEALQGLFDERLLGMKARNLEALNAFQQRKIGGLKLSDKVWNYTKDFEKQMEVSIDQALLEGKSAAELSRDIRSLLKDPDLLFRRVRGDNDQLRMSKAMEAFHPGTGKYRSAYANAMRLARSEINIAYRSSDTQTAQDFDACVGIEVHLSNNHNCKGVPDGEFYDICDELQGKYPKDFKFTGWHPQCRCYTTYILKTDEEFWRDLEDGVNRESVNTVKDVPDNFKEWLSDNEERIATAEERGTLPYFLRDNGKFVNGQYQLNLHTTTPASAPSFVYDTIKDQSITYSQDNQRQPITERVKNLLDGIEGAYGDNGFIRLARSKNLDDPAVAQDLWDQVLKPRYLSANDTAVYQSISHFNELRTADLSKVPAQWQSQLNDLIKKINSHDFKQGCFGVYHEIEHAYNIYKLSTTKEAIDFGLDKLSDKTPYQLFTILQKKIGGFPIPEKEFFDKFDTFVPLVTQGKGAYHSPSYGHVCIAINDKKILERLETSQWYQKGLMYHEYGHALDHQKGLRSGTSFTEMFDNWKSEILKDNGKALEESIGKILQKERSEFYDWWKDSTENKEAFEKKKQALQSGDIRAYNKAVKEYNELYQRLYKEHLYDMEEELGALSDCLAAALEGKRRVPPRDHLTSYFKYRDNQLSEFMAHCFENYWVSNKYFKQLSPDLYKLMTDYIKSL